MKKQLLAVGICSLTCLLPARAIATSFTGLYVFGDSLSDSGNLFNLTQRLTSYGFPPAPYVNGRFSNGSIWVDYLAQDLGLSPQSYPSIVFQGSNSRSGINFATGGATTGAANTVIPGILPGLERQVKGFTSLIPPWQSADANALYLLWAGANDYLPTTSRFTPRNQATIPISNLSSAINSLFTVGARNFLVANLPALGELPSTKNSADAARLNRLTRQHNRLLATNLSRLNQTLPGVTLLTLDVNTLFDQALAGEFGFTTVSEPCFNPRTGQVCRNPDQYLFWDTVHPTTAAHYQVSRLALETLQARSQQKASVNSEQFASLSLRQGALLSEVRQEGIAIDATDAEKTAVTVPEPASGWGIGAVALLGLSLIKRQPFRN